LRKKKRAVKDYLNAKFVRGRRRRRKGEGLDGVRTLLIPAQLENGE